MREIKWRRRLEDIPGNLIRNCPLCETIWAILTGKDTRRITGRRPGSDGPRKDNRMGGFTMATAVQTSKHKKPTGSLKPMKFKKGSKGKKGGCEGYSPRSTKMH